MRTKVQFILGSFFVSLSVSLMAHSIFQYDLVATTAGILGFPISYSILGIENSSLDKVRFSRKHAVYFACMVIGSIISAKGLIIAAKATETLNLEPMIYSGIIMMSGLALTHESYVRGFM